MSIAERVHRVQEARSLYEAGQVNEAILFLTEVLEQDYDNVKAREFLGDIYFARDEYYQARKQYRRIFDQHRHRVSAALKLVQVYLCLPHRLRQAYNVLAETVHHNPNHIEALLHYANFCRVLVNEGEDVETLYQRIESLSAGYVGRELTCAEDHLFTGQLERAKEACARALALDGQDSRIYQLLCHIYLAEGVLWAAHAAAERVLTLAGPSVQAYYDLASVCLKANEALAALEAWECALACAQTDQERVPLWRQMALVQIEMGFCADAVHTLEQLLAVDEQDRNALYSLVVAHQQSGDYAMALHMLAVRIMPLLGTENAQARLLQGTLYLQAGELEQARDLFAALAEGDPHCADYHYYLAVAEHQLGHKIAACKEVNRVLRYNRHHSGALALYAQLHARPSDKEQQKPDKHPFFDPLDLDEFLSELEIDDRIAKLVAYVEMRYWKERDTRGKKPEVSHRTIVLIQVVMGLKDWNLHQLHEKLRSRKHGDGLRELLGLPKDPGKLPVYTTFERRLESLGVYPLKFLMRQWVREAIEKGYLDVSNILLDTSLISAHTDLARVFPGSATCYSDPEADWSYPKPWTGRVFGFKLSLATDKAGVPIDADLVPANLQDITLAKQAVRRLGRTFAPLRIKVECVIGDAGYCSDPLRDLVAEVLGAMPLFHFNPRKHSQRQSHYTYLDDPAEWVKEKRRLRQIIERTFAQLKKHFGLDNLRIRGLTQVAQYMLSRCLAYLACIIVAHKVGRPDLKASPTRLLYSC